MNLRGLVKEAVLEALDGNTDAGSNVSVSKVRRYDVDKLPGLSIYTPKETSERQSRNPTQYLKTCTVNVDVVTKLTDTYEQELDLITGQIEDAILAMNPETYIEGGEDIELGDTEIFLYGSDDRQTLACATVSTTFSYNVMQDEPDPEPTLSVELENNLKARYE